MEKQSTGETNQDSFEMPSDLEELLDRAREAQAASER